MRRERRKPAFWMSSVPPVDITGNMLLGCFIPFGISVSLSIRNGAGSPVMPQRISLPL